MSRADESADRRVVRRLESRGLAGLGPALMRLEGASFGGRFTFETLFAAGAEGAIYLVRDARDCGARPWFVGKVPLLPYHRPVTLESEGIRRRRAGLREEGRLLSMCGSQFLPAFQGLYEFANPLLAAARGGAFAEPEVVLVMERLPGFDLDAWLARLHRTRIDVRRLRPTLDAVAEQLLKGLADLEDRGLHYADLRPGNVRIGGPQRKARLLDAGSLVRMDDESGRFPHVPAYLPPEVFRRVQETNEAIRPSAAVQAQMAGRTLFEVATGGVPVAGEPIDAARLKGSRVSPHVAAVIADLCSGATPDVREALARLGRADPRRGPLWRKMLGG